MGQAESSPNKTDNLFGENRQETLIKQYSGVDINSVKSATGSSISDKDSRKGESSVENNTLKRESKDPSFETNKKAVVDVQSHDDRLKNFGFVNCESFENDHYSIRVDHHQLKSDEACEVIPKGDYHHSSSEKIFEEHAEYANELLNAPYNLTTKYNSVETVNSGSRVDSQVDISSSLFNNPGEIIVHNPPIGRLEVADKRISNKIKTGIAPKEDITVIDVSNKLVPSNLDPPSPTYANVPDYRIVGKEVTQKLPTVVQSLNSPKGSRLKYLKDKFENNPDEAIKNKNIKLETNKDLINSASDRYKFVKNDHLEVTSNVVHEPLARKKAVIVDLLGGDINTSDSTKQSDTTTLSGQQMPISVNDTHADDSIITYTSDASSNAAVINDKTIYSQSLSGSNKWYVLPQNRVSNKYSGHVRVAVPNESRQSINTNYVEGNKDGNFRSLNVTDKKRNHNNASINVAVNNIKPHEKDRSIKRNLASEHRKSFSKIQGKKPHVQALRRKFEHISELNKDSNTGCINTVDSKVPTAPYASPWIQVKDDREFEKEKYPIVKSKSDGHIKFADENKVDLKLLTADRIRSKDDADSVYEEYLMRTSFRKNDSLKPFIKYSVNSPVLLKRQQQQQQNNKIPIYEEKYLLALPSSISPKQEAKSGKSRSPSPIRIKQLNNSRVDKTIHHPLSRKSGTPSPLRTKDKVERRRTVGVVDNSTFNRIADDFEQGVYYDDCVVVEPQKESINKAAKSISKEETEDMDFKSKKEKRHRRKSDSSTSNLSDSSSPMNKSIKKWKKSKEYKDKQKKKTKPHNHHHHHHHQQEEDMLENGGDPELSQQWGSMITEYQDKYVSESDRKNMASKQAQLQKLRGSQMANMEQYGNVKQVFNKGMVLPVKRAPPGMSAQEVESDSGVTDYSTHSWTAVHRPNQAGMSGFRAHMDGAEYNNASHYSNNIQQYHQHQQQQHQQHQHRNFIDDSFSSSVGVAQNDHNAGGRHQPGRMRFSSQSSQYTSDGAPLSPGRQRRRTFAEAVNRQYGSTNGVYNDMSSHGISRRSSTGYNSDRAITPEGHHHSRILRHHSDFPRPSSPESLPRMRLAKQTVSYSSDGGAMSPKIVKKFRAKSLPREQLLLGENRFSRDRSQSKERLDNESSMERHYQYGNSRVRPSNYSNHHVVEYSSLNRPHHTQQRSKHARSMSRDRLNSVGIHKHLAKRSMSADHLDDYRIINSPSVERRMTRDRSMSRERFHDDVQVPLSPSSQRKHQKIVQFDKKKGKKKKTFDEKAKGFVDDVIDEAIDLFTMSPKSSRKSKSRENLSSNARHKNSKQIVNTTNIFNEYVEDDDSYHYNNNDRMIDKRAYSDFEGYSRSHSGYHNRSADNLHGVENLRNYSKEVDYRKPSLLRPAPIDSSMSMEKRASIRPVAGSGITKDGNIPPPKSAYKNYDFEIGVGPFQYSAEEKKKQREIRAHQHYSSESEYSTTLDYRNRQRKQSSYPNISFGPTRAKSEENLLSASRKSSFIKPPPKHPVVVRKKPAILKRIVKQYNSDNNVEYQSEPEDKAKKINPPTLTKGMVTKIMHKLEDDQNKMEFDKIRRNKRQPLELLMNEAVENNDYMTNTWPLKDASTVNTAHIMNESQVGVSMYNTLPSQVNNANSYPSWERQNSNLSSYSTYLPPNINSPGPLQASSPIIKEQNQLLAKNPATSNKQDGISSNIDHTRFKIYHGDHIKLQPDENRSSKNLNMQMGDKATLNVNVKSLTPVEEKEEGKYGAYSNEQIIVADLMENQGNNFNNNNKKNEKFEVRKVGQLVGTQPDVSMNKQQTLNFYLFNQSKSGDEGNVMEPQMKYMARNVEYTNQGQKEIQTDLFVNEDTISDTETELREYLIHHKQTQTPSAVSPPKRKPKPKKQYIVVQQPNPPAPQRKHVETTHYITQEREIERVQPHKELREMCIQTDNEEQASEQFIEEQIHVVDKTSPPKPERIRTNTVEQSSYITRPIITESRQMQKHNYELPQEESSPESSRSVTPTEKGRIVPMMVEPDWNQQYLARLEHEYQMQHQPNMELVDAGNREVAVISDDDDETVILETTEIEEREQRISMAIFEEIEFSSNRTEGGRPVALEGITDGSQIPNFWDPDKYEAVVDRRKKKMVQVKETNQENTGIRTRHPALEGGTSYNGSKISISERPMAVEQQNQIDNHKNNNDMSEEITEKIAALDKVLEDELAKDEHGAEEASAYNRNIRNTSKKGRNGQEAVNERYVGYEKVVDISQDRGKNQREKNFEKDRNIPVLRTPPKYNELFTTTSRVDSLSPQALRKKSKNTTMYPALKTTNSQYSDKEFVSRSKSPTLSQRIKKIKSSYQHTPLDPLFVTQRGEMYGRTDKIHHHPGVPVNISELDPNNVSFAGKEVEGFRDAEEINIEMDTVHEYHNPIVQPPPVLSGQTVHSQQSEPVLQTHYEKDKDGNLIKVTEWQHKLTKTVEYPENKNASPEKDVEHTMNDKLPEAGYIKMNLQNISSSGQVSETETNDCGSESYSFQVNSKKSVNTGPEVVEETEIGMKPYHYESKENTLKVEDDPEVTKERQFLYDIKKAQLKPIPQVYRNGGWGRKHTYGSMSTQL